MHETIFVIHIFDKLCDFEFHMTITLCQSPFILSREADNMT